MYKLYSCKISLEVLSSDLRLANGIFIQIFHNAKYFLFSCPPQYFTCIYVLCWFSILYFQNLRQGDQLRCYIFPVDGISDENQTVEAINLPTEEKHKYQLFKLKKIPQKYDFTSFDENDEIVDAVWILSINKYFHTRFSLLMSKPIKTLNAILALLFVIERYALLIKT